MKKAWETKELGDVIEIRNGRSQQQVLSKKGQYPIMGSAGNLMGYATDYICEAGTTIIGRKGNISKPIFINQRFWNVDTAFGFYPKDEKETDKKIIYYLCLSIDFAKMNRGTTIPSLVKSELQKISIQLPLITEQRRIVSVLDEAFANISKAKDKAEQNLKNAKELFESYLQSVFTDRGANWEEKTLGAVYDVRDGTHDSPKYTENGFALITSKNLKKDVLNYDNVNYISEADYFSINKRSKVDKGDILFAMIGTIGNPVVVQSEPDFAIKNVALFKVPKEQNSYFLKYYLDAKIVIDKMMGDAKGTTQKFVGLGYLRGFTILLPPLNEQIIIVKKLDELSIQTKKLEAIYEQKLKDLEELKKSILQKAFNGEL